MTNHRFKQPPPAGRNPLGNHENARPTVSPPFDVEAFARKASGAEEQRAWAEAPTERPPLSPESADFDVPTRPRHATRIADGKADVGTGAPSAPDGSTPRSQTSSLLSIANEQAPSQPSFELPFSSRSSAPIGIENVIGGSTSSSSPPEITERTIENPADEMRERFNLGNYTGALEVAELLLTEDPGNLEAAECGGHCRTVLERMYTARLGPLDRIPLVTVARTQMRWLSMDHRAGFVLSLIDGSSTVEMILDVCGMPRLDALRILHELSHQKIVAFG